MPIPLIVAGVAAGAGALAGAAAKAERDGKSAPRHSGSFQETKYYDPNATKYGGTETGLRDYNANLNYRRVQAEQRGANTANYGQANAYGTQGAYARQNQSDMAGLMMRRAAGGMPSIAGQQAEQSMGQLGRQTAEQQRLIQQNAQQQSQQATAAQTSMQAGARGAGAMALAQQNAANNTAAAQSGIGRSAAQASQNVGMGATNAATDIATQAQVNAAHEREAAERAAFDANSGMRKGDQEGEMLAGKRAEFQAGQEQQNRDANDKRAMGYEELEGRANAGAQNAAVANQGQLASSHAAADAHNAAAYAEREKNDKGWAESIFGGMKDGASAVSSDERAKTPIHLAGARAAGGPVSAGKPYLVGERGPEVVVPKQGGTVVPNHQVRDLGDVEDWGPSTDSMLDDRQAQYGGGQDTIGRAALDREIATQAERDEAEVAAAQAAPQYRSNDPAVGLERAGAERRRRELMGESRPASAAVNEDEERGVAPGTSDFEKTAPKVKKEPWWMQDVSKYMSDEDAKTPIDMGDVESWGPQKGQDEGYRHRSFQSQMDSELRGADERKAAMKTEERNTPKLFKRDTKTDQKAVKDAFYARLMKDADSKIAGMKASVKHGASVALDEGDVDEAKDTRVASNSFSSDDKTKLTAAKREAYMLGRAHQDEFRKTGKPPGGDFEWSATESGDLVDRHINPDRMQPSGAGRAESTKPGQVKRSELVSRYEVGPQSALEPEPLPPRPADFIAPDGPSPLPPPKAPRLEQPYEEEEPMAYPERQATPDVAPWSRTGQMVRHETSARHSGGGRKRSMSSDERAKVGLGVEKGPVADANRAMKGEPYAYKPEHTPEHEEQGQPHFGFMAGNLRKSPVSRVAVEKDPKTGLDRVDRDRMLQVVAAGVSDLQRQQDELRVGLKRGGKKR